MSGQTSARRTTAHIPSLNCICLVQGFPIFFVMRHTIKLLKFSRHTFHRNAYLLIIMLFRCNYYCLMAFFRGTPEYLPRHGGWEPLVQCLQYNIILLNYLSTLRILSLTKKIRSMLRQRNFSLEISMLNYFLVQACTYLSSLSSYIIVATYLFSVLVHHLKN